MEPQLRQCRRRDHDTAGLRAFTDGRGEFYGQETLNGQPIVVRFVISDVTAVSCRFEQAFSVDGRGIWETNWIAIDTRVE